MNAVAAQRQRDEAREIANRIRFERLAIRRALKARTITLADAFERDAAQAMPVCELLEAVPYLTAGKAGWVLLACRIPYAQPVGSIGPFHRRQILARIRALYPRIRGIL